MTDDDYEDKSSAIVIGLMAAALSGGFVGVVTGVIGVLLAILITWK
jgi:hypothetical protein